MKRQPGKQVGAPGVGRTQVLTDQTIEAHRPAVFARCGQALSPRAPAVSYTGFQSLDLAWGDPVAPGLRLRVIDRRYLDVTCSCGHHMPTRPRARSSRRGARWCCGNGAWWGQVSPP